MNIIERNYLSKLDLRDTQKAINLIEKSIIESLENKIDFIMVRQPIVSSNKISVNTDKEEQSRQINFDSSNDNLVHYIFNDYRYWLVDTISKLDIKNNNGIAMLANYIDRDVEIRNTKSMEQRKLLIEYRFDSENQDYVFKKANELNKLVYDSIKQVQKDLIIKFPELKDNLLPKTIDEKDLKKVSSKGNVIDALSDIASDEGTFLLKDIRDTKKDRSLINSFELSLYSFKKEINEAYRIYKVQDRKTMSDIQPFISESDAIMEEYRFGKEILKDNNTRTINIEIDLDALSLLLLDKSHILEIQSGKTLEEIEKILNEANVKHL